MVFVFALDKKAVLQLVERDVTHAPVAPEALADHRAFFSKYLFARFFVSPQDMPAEWGEGVQALDARWRARQVSDFIAGMTDRFALQEHARLFAKKAGS